MSIRTIAFAALLLLAAALPSVAAEPIRIGFSVEETGGSAASGRQFLLTAQIWADRVNKNGGLLGRPVELIHYDDQSNPALVPGIYTKLLDVDKVDLIIASGTNYSAAAMPLFMERKLTVLNTLALAVNDEFHYPRSFQTMPYGPHGKEAITAGYFAAAMTIDPRPKTIAMTGADAEFAKNAMAGAREHAKKAELQIVYDKNYPLNTIDYTPIVRAIKATNPDLVFVASYPADSAGMFFPGIDDFIQAYQARAKEAGTDPLGYYVPPLVYATFQVLEQVVEGTKSLDQDKLAQYMHATNFKTIMGDIRFGPDGEWAEPRILTIQYQGVKGNDLEQFSRPGVQVILDPPAYKTGTLIYPYTFGGK